MKIYHAHGFVVRNNFPVEGEEIWNSDSSFSKVFGDFESARSYILDCFECRLENIYANDGLFSSRAEKRQQIKDKNSSWRREYIDEYIFYQLLISEIDSDIWGNERGKSMPDEVVWYIRYNGEISSRFLVFGDKEYEFRPSDEAEGAGEKFKAGDIVRLTDWEDERGRDLFVVYKTPAGRRGRNMAEPLYSAGRRSVWQHARSQRGGVSRSRPCFVFAKRFGILSIQGTAPLIAKCNYGESCVTRRNLEQNIERQNYFQH